MDSEIRQRDCSQASPQNFEQIMRLWLLWLALTGIAVAQAVDPTTPNGSGCVANGTPAYCNKAFTGLSTDPANTNAQTQLVVPPPQVYNASSIRSAYLYSGATTRVLMHYQPWFCNTGTTCNSHINVGYNENSTTTVAAQMTAMKALGVDVIVPDYYGNSASKAFNLATVNAIATVIQGDPTAYPKLLLGMDAGAFSNSGQCPQGSGITTAQMEACIDTQLDYAAANYFYQSYYETFGGKPIVTFFLDETGWPSVDWNAVWVHEHAHVAQGQSCGSGCTYTAQVLLLGRNSASITRTGLDGSFAWPPTSTYSNASPSTQFNWNGTAGYLDNFYTICRANPSKLCIGLLYKGFDDSNASFGTDKITAQQCGQIFNFTGAKVGALGYSSTSQLPYIQIATWNDYEEGTTIENGVKNCYTLSATLTGTNVNWTLNATDATYSSLTTIDHMRLLYSTGTGYQIGVDNIPVTSSGSMSVASLPKTSFIVQAVGKPTIAIINSNEMPFTAVAPAPTMFTAIPRPESYSRGE